MPFAKVYPLYLAKVAKKGRTVAEVHQVIHWLTGYNDTGLQYVLDNNINFDNFFANAPLMHPNAKLITGKICGVQIETIEHKLMRNIRYLDKLVDELAKGKKMEKICRV